MSRYSYVSGDAEIAYGYDHPLQTYFVQVFDLTKVDDYEFDPSGEGFAEEYANNPMSLMHPNGKVCTNGEILEQLKRLGCTNEEHLDAIALDQPF